MTFRVIAGDAETPQAVRNAIALLNSNGYDIAEKATDKAVIELNGIDKELGFFIGKFATAGTWAEASKGIKVSYLDLALLDGVAHAIAEARTNRAERHALTYKYFNTVTPTTDLYRNLAGFRSAFAGLDRNETYKVKIQL